MIPELDPAIALAHLSSAWNPAAGLGAPYALERPLLFPIVLFDSLLRGLGASAIAVNHFWLYFFILFQALFTVQLFQQLFPSVQRPIATVYCGIAAFLNPFTLIWMHGPYPTTQIAVTAFPGLLAATICYVRRGAWLAFMEFVVLAFFEATSWMNPAIFIVTFALFVVTCVALLAGLRSVRGATLRVTPLLLVYAASNILWALPIYNETAFGIHRFVESQTTYSLETIHSVSQYSGLTNSARLVGGYLFFNPVGQLLYLPSGPSYAHNAVVVIGSLGLPVLALIGLVLGLRSRVVGIVAGIGAVALFGAKGAAWPAGWLFEWAALHVTPFMAFRNSFDKFEWVVLLAYALLAGYALGRIWAQARRVTALALTVGAFTLLVVGGYPFFRGELFWGPLRVSVPPRYTAMASWLNARGKAGRVLEMPVAPVLFDTYKWGYFGSSLNANLLARPLLGRLYDLGLDGNASIDDLMQHYRVTVGASRAAVLLGLYGFRYLLSDPTIDPNAFGPNQTDAAGSHLPKTSVARRFSSLSLLEIDGNLVNPIIYAANQIVTGPKDLAEEALACDTLESCKDVVILQPRFANDFAADCCTQFTFVSPLITYDLLHMKTSDSGWLRSALAELAPPPTPVDVGGGRRYVDYSNQTAVALSPPRVGDAELATGFQELLRVSHLITLCALPHETRLVQISLPGELRPGDFAILNLAVLKTRLNVEVSVVNLREPSRGFTEPVEASIAGGQLSRVFRVAAPGTDYALRIYARGAEHAGCATIDDVTLGRANDHPVWSLLGSPTNLNATPPYLARHPDIIARYINAPLQPADTFGRVHRAAAPPSFTAPWSAAEYPSPEGGIWAEHATFAHLLPGAEYRLSVPLRLISGSNPRIALYSQNGQYLESIFPPLQHRPQIASASVFLPEDSTELVVYFYLDGRGSSVTLRVPSLTLLSGRSLLVRRSALTHVARPRSIRISANASDWEIAVSGAPRHYILAFTGSYDPQWTLLTPPGVRARHKVANLFTNAWFIDGAGSYRMSLRFAGNRYVTIAYFACAIFFFLGVLDFALVAVLHSPTAESNRTQ